MARVLHDLEPALCKQQPPSGRNLLEETLPSLKCKNTAVRALLVNRLATFLPKE